MRKETFTLNSSDGSSRLPDGKCDRKCSQHAQ